MKSFLILSLVLSLVSCGGGSNNNVQPFSTPINFSESKFNEDLVSKFAIPEMKNVIAALESIKAKTETCSSDSDFENLKPDWEKAAFAYHRLKPIEDSILDRDPQVVLKLKERYLGGVYSVANCRLQQNTAKQSLLTNTLVFDPAINSLEFLIYGDLANTNFCRAKGKEVVNDWLLSGNKNEDICNHINFVTEVALTELKEINKNNEDLYKAGKSSQIIPKDNLQTAYNKISLFIEEVLISDGIGYALGLLETCNFIEGQTCPTAVNHLPSEKTFEAVSKNLEGIMMVYNQQTEMSETPQGKGLYQFLLANQKSEVADEFYSSLIEAYKISTALHGQDLSKIAADLAGVQNKQRCLDTTAENMMVPACALFKSFKNLRYKLQGDLRLALELSKTIKIEGDSD